MRIPYSHAAALAQMPVPYKLGDSDCMVYPMTVGATLDMNLYVQRLFCDSYDTELELLPSENRQEFLKGLYDKLDTMTYASGEGYKVFVRNESAVIRFVKHLLRHDTAWDDERIRTVLMPDGITEATMLAVYEMKLCVHRDMPVAPKLNIVDKPPRYKATPEETEARLYAKLAEKYGWGWEYIMKLTDYQVFWYSYMYPEEREHIEDMDALSHKGDGASPLDSGRLDVQPEAGTIHFNSPEEYEAWKRVKEKAQNAMKTM